jgi:hypothetical protein
MSFTTQIENIKAEIDAGLAATQYTAKDLVYVAKAIEALANAEGSAGTFEEATINSILYVGENANDFEDTGNLTDPIAIFSKEGGPSSFAQIAFRNEEPTSSTDIIAYMSNGDDTYGWVSMGITGPQFNDPEFGLTGPGDAYIFHEAKAGTGIKGNLVLATGSEGTENKIVFAAGGFADDESIQMEITPGENVHIEIPTASTSPSTGALTIVGGVGIQGDVNIAGNITFGGEGTSLETSTLSVADPLIFVGSGNTTDAVDLGLIAEYATGEDTKYAGVVRDATDGVVKFFKDATTRPTSSVNFAEVGLAYSDIKAASIDVSSAIIGNVSNTELQYLDGVTSAIQTQLDSKAVYPSQINNSGKYLTTNGTTTSWATVDALPAQANNSGYYLTTDGTIASWQPITTDPNPNIFMLMGA